MLSRTAKHPRLRAQKFAQIEDDGWQRWGIKYDKVDRTSSTKKYSLTFSYRGAKFRETWRLFRAKPTPQILETIFKNYVEYPDDSLTKMEKHLIIAFLVILGGLAAPIINSIVYEELEDGNSHWGIIREYIGAVGYKRTRWKGFKDHRHLLFHFAGAVCDSIILFADAVEPYKYYRMQTTKINAIANYGQEIQADFTKTMAVSCMIDPIPTEAIKKLKRAHKMVSNGRRPSYNVARVGFGKIQVAFILLSRVFALT